MCHGERVRKRETDEERATATEPREREHEEVSRERPTVSALSIPRSVVQRVRTALSL
jgi:hypothetical protein